MKSGRPLAAALLIATLAGAEPARPSSSRWEESAPLPRGIAGHAAGASGGTQWIAGGSWWDSDRKRIESGIWRLAATASTWTYVSMIPGGFAHGGWAATPTELWLAGGLGENGVSGKIFRVQFASGSVAQIGRLPEPRVYAGAALLGGVLYVVGGAVSENEVARASSKWWRITPGPDDTCTVQAGRNAGPAWINPVVLALRGELHVLPGGVWSGKRQRLEAPSEAWIYSPTQDRWRQRPLAAPLPRGLSGIALDDGKALLAGGVETRPDGSALATTVWIYDAATGAVTAGPALPTGRLAGALTTEGCDVWLLGGEDRARSRTATTWHWRRPDTAQGDAR
ncbi:MAG: hypothetical protein V4773_24630 [Verrucomicrobiota bacterium]